MHSFMGNVFFLQLLEKSVSIVASIVKSNLNKRLKLGLVKSISCNNGLRLWNLLDIAQPCYQTRDNLLHICGQLFSS